jgi:hypothetical protein
VRGTSESYASAMSGSTIGGRRNPQSNGGMSPAKMIVRETRALRELVVVVEVEWLNRKIDPSRN